MTIGKIIESVRFCIDEELANGSHLAAYAGDDTRMDGIIKNKIGDALRWVSLYAPSELLGGSDSGSSQGQESGILVDKTGTFTSGGSEYKYIGLQGRDNGYGRIVTEDSFIRLVRVRVSGWHRAVKTPLDEESDEYLQLFDEYGATAVSDRPQAALIDKKKREIEVWPVSDGDTVEYTFAASIPDSSIDTSTDKNIPLPPNVVSGFIYYLAFLLLSAYNDSRSSRMLEIARMNIGAK